MIGRTFSAATCRGLIEAGCPGGSARRRRCFPRLHAAASLKLERGEGIGQFAVGFPRLHAAASLKHHRARDIFKVREGFSAATCRGLIEAMRILFRQRLSTRGFPRLHAAASLKHGKNADGEVRVHGFPRLHAAASLKLEESYGREAIRHVVFRGYMPRPH